MRRFLLVFVLFPLIAGCSKEKPMSPFAPFVGVWQGVAISVNDNEDIHDIKISLSQTFDGNVEPLVVCDIIPSYKYILFSDNNEILGTHEVDFNKGDILIFFRNEQQDIVTGITCRHTQMSEEIIAIVHVFGKGKYNSRLYKL